MPAVGCRAIQKGGYFWPIYGELDEVCFPFFDSRAHSNVETVLGLAPGKGSVLLSDGYGAYEAYAQKPASRMLNVTGH